MCYPAQSAQKPVFGWGSTYNSPRPLGRLGRETFPPHALPLGRIRRLDIGAYVASVLRLPVQIPGCAAGPTATETKVLLECSQMFCSAHLHTFSADLRWGWRRD